MASKILLGVILIFVTIASNIVAIETSDETPDNCILPPFQKNGFYTIRDESTEKPKVKIHNQPVLRSRVRLEYACREGYQLKGPTSTICYNGFWTHTDQPKCLSQCALDKNPSVHYLCFPSNSTSPLSEAYICDTLVYEDTTVRPLCHTPFYDHTEELADMQCIGGVWDYVATCLPECGTVAPIRLREKKPANHGSTPWHVGVYFKLKKPYLQICGGSIITSELIISAAHCFWGEVKRQRPASDFAVAAGNLFRHWNSQLDQSAQKSDVSEIRLPARFSGLKTNYRDDIAVLRIATPFQFEVYVRPICLDFDHNFEGSQLTIGKTGKIASWGRSAQAGVEEHWQFLQEVDLPFVSDEQCLMESPPEIREYITADKFCAYYNDTARELCQGDTGGGLAFPAWSRGEERYFLRGVASAARGDKEYCVSFTTFTQVIRHEQFIKEYYKPIKDQCILPPFPDHGTYSTNIPNAIPGEAYDTVNISVSCQQGYGVEGSSSVYCYNGLWTGQIPRCFLHCHLAPHYSVEYRCLMPGGGLRTCNEYELTGTVVRPRCRSPEYFSPVTPDDMLCREGNWTYVARCSSECAIHTTVNTDFSFDKKNLAHGEIPWHGGIYNKSQPAYEQLCGATLISRSVLLSAAHCFWNHLDDRQRPAVEFAVGIGKLYRPWTSPQEENFAQQSDVKELHLPASFRGLKTNFQDDIAVVIVSVPFNYTAYVRPVCLEFGATFIRKQLQPGVIGVVAGWGLTRENGTASQVLKYLNVPYANIETCISQSPKNFLEYITSDKICGGYTSVSSPRSPVCKGDSGGGWVFPEQHGDKLRFFLQGIISIAPQATNNNLCNFNAYTFFTAIQIHDQFIKKFWQDGELHQ